MGEEKNAVRKEPPRFLATEPYHYAKLYAEMYHCDLAVPGMIGIGSLVCYTRLVEAFALRVGHPLRLLTTPLDYSDYGTAAGEIAYPIWLHNPYIAEIVNANDFDKQINEDLSAEMDNFCQPRHEIENLCAPYGLRPRKLFGQLFLSTEEMAWGLQTLAHLKRPVVCICPYGRSSPPPESVWYLDKWLRLLAALEGTVSFFQLGNNHFQQKEIPVFTPVTTLRQAMALIWASDVYVGFDTGLSHIAAALERPALVLWDAVRKAQLEEAKQPGFSLVTMGRWTYAHTRNIAILGEKHDEVLEACIEFILETIAQLHHPTQPVQSYLRK